MSSRTVDSVLALLKKTARKPYVDQDDVVDKVLANFEETDKFKIAGEQVTFEDVKEGLQSISPSKKRWKQPEEADLEAARQAILGAKARREDASRDRAKGKKPQSERQGEKANPRDQLGLSSTDSSSCSDTDEECEERCAHRGKSEQMPKHQQEQVTASGQTLPNEELEPLINSLVKSLLEAEYALIHVWQSSEYHSQEDMAQAVRTACQKIRDCVFTIIKNTVHRKGAKPFFVKLMNLSARYVESLPEDTDLTSVLEQGMALIKASGLKAQDIMDVLQKHGADGDRNMYSACFSVKKSLGKVGKTMGKVGKTIGKIAAGPVGKIAVPVIVGLLKSKI